MSHTSDEESEPGRGVVTLSSTSTLVPGLYSKIGFFAKHARVLRQLVLGCGDQGTDPLPGRVRNDGAFLHPTLDIGAITDAIPVVLALEHFDPVAGVQGAQCSRRRAASLTQRGILRDHSRLVQNGLGFRRATCYEKQGEEDNNIDHM